MPFVVTPTITQLYSVPIPTKRRAVYMKQNQTTRLSFQFLDGSGNPLDISAYVPPAAPTGTVIFGCNEVISCNSSNITLITGVIDDAATGLVHADIPASLNKYPGVMDIEIGLFATALTTSEMYFSNTIYAWTDRGMFGAAGVQQGGPPSLDDIRVFMRDNGPEENLLIDDFEYDLAEICQAAVYGVRYWNEVQPPILVSYNTASYPYRDNWLRYIGGYLFHIASRRFVRNHLPYAAGGTQIDDQNKFKEYYEFGGQLMAEYKEWVKQKKTQLNAEGAIQSSGSPYFNIQFGM